MPKTILTLFNEPGPANTEATIECAVARARDHAIKHIVVATSTGNTALAVAQAAPDIHVIGVTLCAGTWAKYQAPDAETVKAAQEHGVKFLTATHVLMGNVENAAMEKFGGIGPANLIAHTYYTFGQGTKVAVEVAVMAADAGLIPIEQEVIAIAGTNGGADTALVLKPAFSVNFFEIEVREVICMPRRK